MKQSHTRPSSPGRPILPADLHVTQDTTRSPMARASDGLPFKSYVWHGIPGPVIGAPRWKNGTQVGTVHAGDDADD